MYSDKARGFFFRKAEIKDIQAIKILIEKSAKAINNRYYSDKQIAKALETAWSVDEQLILDRTYWVVENKVGLMIGCGGWSKRKRLFGKTDQSKEFENQLIPGIDAAKIRSFFIHPAYTRQGIGSKLLEICETAAKLSGFTAIELVATLSGEKLYTAKGYIGGRPYEVDLKDGVTNKVIAMHKSLK